VLGFRLVGADLVEVGDDGRLKHFFFDIGNGQLMGFMSGEDVRGYPKDFDAGINKGLGLAPGVYHFAFDAETEQDLLRIRDHLQAHGTEGARPRRPRGLVQVDLLPGPERTAARGVPLDAPARGRRRDPARALPPGAAQDAAPAARRRRAREPHLALRASAEACSRGARAVAARRRARGRGRAAAQSPTTT
jgi:hypothetical protein